MSSEVSDARTRLYEALTANGALPGWRVWRTTPAQVAAPTVFIDSVELGLDSIEGATFIGAIFPVVIVADGAVRAQVEALDDTLAYVWDSCRAAGGEPTDSRPINLDVGGPTLRAHVLRVGMLITARTLCPAPVSGGIVNA